MRIRRYLPLLPCLAAASPSVVTADGPPARVVLVVLDDLTVADMATLRPPTMTALSQQGGIALLNVQSFSGSSFHRGCLTLGAGAKATGPESVAWAYNVLEPVGAETAAQVYRRRTGNSPAGAAIVDLGLGPAITSNVRALAPGRPGLLGAALRTAGIRCAVIGNSDTSLEYTQHKERRDAVTLLMDTEGRVPAGEVSKALLREDPAFPFGLRADPEAYERAFLRRLGECQVIAVDVGETFRAEAFRTLATPEQGQRLKEQAVLAADVIVGKLAAALDFRRDLLLLLAPSVPLTDRYRLAPLLAVGKGIPAGSWLTSPSTRRPGLVALTDLAPTILHHLQVPFPPEFVGRPLTGRRGQGTWETLHRRNLTIAATDRIIRRAVLTPAGFWEGTVLLVAGWLLCGTLAGIRRRWLRAGVISLPVLYPVSFLVKPLTGVTLFAPQLVVLFVFAVAGLIAWRLARWTAGGRQIATAVAVVTVAAMVLDTCTGARLSLNSILGYSPYFGGRYYGVGNIVASAMIGATLAAVAGWNGFRPVQGPGAWAALGVTLAGMCVVVGHPRLGANVGGGIAAVAAFGTYAWVVSGRRLNIRLAAVLAATVAAAVAVQIAADLRAGPGQASHLGHLVDTASLEGTHPVVQMVTTKIQVFTRSFRHFYWTVALLGAIVGWGKWRLAAGAPGPPAADSLPFRALVNATFVGGAVALLLNDSGPACPAVIFSFGLAAAFLWLLDEVPADRAG